MSSKSTPSAILGWAIKTTVGEPLTKESRGFRNQDGVTEIKSCRISNFIFFLDIVSSQGDEALTDFRKTTDSPSPEPCQIRQENANYIVVKFGAGGLKGV